ncbi:uncharacterized protein SAPINGB_P000279 [Magnusiomyces paraingens]|uniref:Uncharacterized protein n=1 Tax=Magnusiomyces paraingens TaxID=2606893 RepID=A0A5E8AZC6_9ASCO|nr:uncharacterized protein SAPINGB_P000279 [Saprochaete ingens]VVT44054.1 unnamed protein product [Saprochaete ingens]
MSSETKDSASSDQKVGDSNTTSVVNNAPVATTAVEPVQSSSEISVPPTSATATSVSSPSEKDHHVHLSNADTDVSDEEQDELIDEIEADENLLDEYDPDTDELDLLHLKIRSLLALKLYKLPNLRRACFRQNLIQSMDGLEDLPEELEELDLYDNRISHINHLAQFKDLVQLDLSFNKIRLIKNIAHLTKLTHLYVCQNKISTIENISSLTHLTYLELGANRIRNIEGLEKLVNLEQLWLGKNKITSLQGLQGLTKLRVLSIQSNRIVKLEGLETLTSLEEFYISHNGIEKLENLENNTKLRVLDVTANRLKVLENVSHLENLEEFWASSNQFESFQEVASQLGNLKNLETVYFEFNPLQRKNPVQAGPNTEADEVVEWLHENDMMLITPRNQKTYNNRTNIDLVYGSVDLLHRISFSGVDENTLSDHSIVEWDIYMSQSKNGDEVFTSVKRLNIKNADWEKFDKELSSAIKDFNVHNKTLKSTDQIDDQAKVLEEVVKRAMAKSMKEVKVMKKVQTLLESRIKEKLEKALEAKREARQRQPSLALKRQKIEEAKKARKIFDHSLREASTEQWNKYLSSLEGNDIWKILKHEIWKALLPEIDHGLDREFEIDDDSRWPKLEFDEVDSALADTPNDKAPGDDGITGKVLKMAWLNKDFKERFFKLLQACVKFGYHPKVWRHGIIVVIPKPKKPDYSKPRAYRPISLLKIPSKVLEKIIQKE